MLEGVVARVTYPFGFCGPPLYGPEQIIFYPYISVLRQRPESLRQGGKPGPASPLAARFDAAMLKNCYPYVTLIVTKFMYSGPDNLKGASQCQHKKFW